MFPKAASAVIERPLKAASNYMNRLLKAAEVDIFFVKYLILFSADFRNLFMRLLAAFRNSFGTALVTLKIIFNQEN
jgi:hypothetical protein